MGMYAEMSRLGYKPYLVVMKLHRKIADVNRGVGACYGKTHNKCAQRKFMYDNKRCPNGFAEQIYNEYHRRLEYAIRQAKKLYKNPLLVDIHGNGKPKLKKYFTRGTCKGLCVQHMTKK